MLTRQEFLKQVEDLGYQTMVPVHGQDCMVRLDDTWEIVQDMQVEAPLVYIGHPQLYKILEDYLATPIKYRQIIYPKSTFRVKDAIDALNSIGYESSLTDNGILTVFRGGWKVLAMNTHRAMTTQYYNEMEQRDNGVQIEFLTIIYDLLQTKPTIRYWSYTYEEELLLRRYPDARYLTRNQYTGGIKLHMRRPINVDGVYDSEGSVTLDYKPTLFLYVNYADRPYII